MSNSSNNSTGEDAPEHSQGKERLYRQGALYVALVLLIVASGVFGVSLAWGGYCSGTGTGSNRASLRICLSDNLALYPIVLNLLALAILMVVARVANLSRNAKIVLFAVFVMFVILNSLLLWNIPFFQEPLR